LSLEEACFDKAQRIEEARMRLQQFSGRVHTLHSAVAVFEVDPSKKMVSLVVSDVVDVGMKMRTLTEDTIEQYLKTDEWRGVVGCYRIEGEGRWLFDQVDGDRSEIIGLPMAGLKKTIEAYLKTY
jgi:septum formation protein